MTVDDLTGVITALSGLAIAVGGLIAAIKIHRKVEAVHIQLNSAKDASDRYEQDLRDALEQAGVKIPADQSLRKGDDA
jgi:hypothetical protein